MSSDRNLLFGILALQLDFIDRDRLVAAMHAWVLAKERPLGDLLVEQGALEPQRRQLLDALVAEHLRRHDGDPRKSLAAVRSIKSLRKDLEEIADPELGASLVHVSRDRPLQDPGSTLDQSVGVSSTGLRFRILRPHARGGLGEVHVARDEELKREVALKEIQEKHADHPESRARFLVEAEITGRLEHPGIVPVYGLGQYADGRPFYAMRFIRGDSLKKAIEDHHRQAESPAAKGGEQPVGKGASASDRNLQFRQLLRRFQDVCNAIQYAHDRGVLHRDLKPGNIMLGRYGETLVVDWGLAKAGIQSGEPKPAATSGDEPPLDPAQLSGSSETIDGTALGTPQYMSPEQAAGRLDLLGPASDVYSLGATLYTLLTGKPAVEGKNTAEVLERVRRGAILRPRQVKAEISPALEAVCLKALALEPGARYATPSALAEDIEHWLADEPVSAWPEPWPVRTRRWVGNHRTLVTTAAAVLAVSFVALLVGNRLLSGANELLTTTNQRLSESKRKTEQALVGLRAANSAILLANEKLKVSEKKARDFADLADRARQSEKAERKEKEVQLENTERLLYLIAFRDAVRQWERNDQIGAFESLEACTWNHWGPEFGIFSNYCRKACRILEVHETEAKAMVLSSDGKRLFLGGAPGRSGGFRVWDLESGRDIRHLGKPHLNVTSLAVDPKKDLVYAGTSTGKIESFPTKPESESLRMDAHKALVADLALSLDGKLLYSVDDVGNFKVWDISARKEIRSWKGVADFSTTLAVSADGTRLFSNSLDGTVMWDGRLGDKLKAFPDEIAFAFSPKDRLLYTSGSEDGKIRVWDPESGKEIRSFGSHQEEVICLAISSDGKRLASGTDNHPTGSEIKIWNLEEGSHEQTLRGHPGLIRRLVFSEDGTKIYSASNDGSVREWNLVVDMASADWPTQAEGILALQNSPDGRQLYAAGNDGVLRRWDEKGKSTAPVFPDLPSNAVCLAMDPEGTRLFAGGADGALRVLDPSSGETIRMSKGHSKAITQLSITPDGKFLYSLGADQGIRRWDLATFESTRIDADYPAGCMALSPDGRFLAVGHSRKGEIRVYEPAGETTIRTLDPRMDSLGHLIFARGGTWVIAAGGDTKTRRMALAFLDTTKKSGRLTYGDKDHWVTSLEISRDEKRLITAGADGTLKIWDLESMKELLSIPAHGKGMTRLALSPDGKTLFSGGANGRIKLWTWEQDQRIFSEPTVAGKPFALLPAEQRLVSVFKDNRIRLWDLGKNREVFELKGHIGTVRSLAYAKNRKRLYSGGRDKAIIEWDPIEGKEVRRFGTQPQRHRGSVECLVSSHDDRLLFSGSMDGTVKIWDQATGEERITLAAFPQGVTCLAVSPGSLKLFAGGTDGSIAVLDPLKGKIGVLSGHTDPITSLALAPDGRRLFSASADHTVKVWDTDSMTEIRTLTGHQDAILFLRLSPDGSRLYSASEDFAAPAEIIEWNTATLEKVRTIRGHAGAIECLEVWPNGNWLFSGSRDGSIRVWDLRP